MPKRTSKGAKAAAKVAFEVAALEQSWQGNKKLTFLLSALDGMKADGFEFSVRQGLVEGAVPPVKTATIACQDIDGKEISAIAIEFDKSGKYAVYTQSGETRELAGETTVANDAVRMVRQKLFDLEETYGVDYLSAMVHRSSERQENEGGRPLTLKPA